MEHVIEPAASARAKCRGCGGKIDKGELRFGERIENPFGDGEASLWFHLQCGAYKRPEPFLHALERTAHDVEASQQLRLDAERGIEHRRLPRISGVQRDPSGRARCRCCREPISKNTWRIALVFYEEGRFEPSGFLHVRCSREYFGTSDVLAHCRHFTPELNEGEINQLASEFA